MNLMNDWMLVKELPKDYMIDGLMQKYDDSDPTMLVEIELASKKSADYISTFGNIYDDVVLLVSRGNKTVWHGKYLIKSESIIGVLSREEYDKL